ncbi:MAG: DUF2207 domain-containing protein [Erysipelotrichaceae bacterium]|nr:DUF2207 domain-containing protein [Erysipelotrichaceae bacterium]
MAEKFEYKYSAPTQDERKEIDRIRRQYQPKDQTITKMDRLRYLDNKVKTIPLILSLSVGIIGTLVFGLGLTFILEWSNIPLGVVLMIIGAGIMGIAYLSYSISSKKLKAKYSEEILTLSEELLTQETE